MNAVAQKGVGKLKSHNSEALCTIGPLPNGKMRDTVMMTMRKVRNLLPNLPRDCTKKNDTAYLHIKVVRKLIFEKNVINKKYS